MPAGEIAAAITSTKAAFDIAKTMVGMRDTAMVNARVLDLQEAIRDSLEKAIAAREAQTEQLDTIRALEAEVARLKAWDAEKENYELKPIGRGSVTYMLKPEARAGKTPHWLCPTCFSAGKKSYFQPKEPAGRLFVYACQPCGSTILVGMHQSPEWYEPQQPVTGATA